MTNPIGSGPFRYVASERESGHRVVFDRNPDYPARFEPPDGAGRCAHRQGGSGRLDDHAGSGHCGECTRDRRSRFLGHGSVRHGGVPEAARRHGPPHRLAALGRLDPSEFRVAAVQRCAGPPGPGLADRPEGVHASRCRRDALVQLLFIQRMRLAAGDRGRLGALPQAGCRRRRSSCWPTPATRASR